MLAPRGGDPVRVPSYTDSSFRAPKTRGDRDFPFTNPFSIRSSSSTLLLLARTRDNRALPVSSSTGFLMMNVARRRVQFARCAEAEAEMDFREQCKSSLNYSAGLLR